MKIEINGRQYTTFLAATAIIRIDALTNTFSFVSGVGKNIDLGFGIEDECLVYADGDRIITGHIEVISGSGDIRSSSIDITGRDKTGDLADSMIGSMSDLKTPIKLKRVIEKVILHIGAEIDVIDLTDFVLEKNEDLVAPEPGDNAFAFIEKLARIKKAIISSNANGDVVIERAFAESIQSQITNVVGDDRNNVLSYSFNFDNTGRFNKYETIGNQNINTLVDLGAQIPKKVVDKRGFAIDKLIREGRQFVISSENPGSAKSMTERSLWESNIRKARSRVYKAVVTGYRNQTGNLWTPNTIVRVIDDNAKINDVMLINSVTYRLDDAGRTTELELINKDAYSLKIDEPVVKKDVKTSKGSQAEDLAAAFAKTRKS